MSTNKFSRVHLFVGAALATLTISSQAAFTVEDEPRASRSEAIRTAAASPRSQAGKGDYIQLLGGKTARRGAITQVGVPDESIAVVTGFGKDLPFATGLSQIVPRGWHGYSEDPKMKSVGNISWDGGRRPWITVLNEVLLENGLMATVDWDTKEIMFGIDPNSDAQSGTSSRASAAGMSAAVTTQSWVLESGKTLRTNLEAWVKRAGWTLSWGPEDVDYNITAGVELQGELSGDAGAITQVISKYRNAGRPLMVTFYNGNRVVRIDERVATQTGPR